MARRLNTTSNVTILSSSFRAFSGLPDSVKRVGESAVFPNEYPGQIYAFNWALNRDGVTPLNKSAFRITKTLDLKIAGLDQPKTNPLKVTPAPDARMPEAGSDELSFDSYDEAIQRTKDALSQSAHLYCPEGHAPATHTGVRVISNSATLAPDLVAYLDRAPRSHKPVSQSVTVYALENAEEDFAGYAIEEVEEMDQDTGAIMDPKSVAAVVVSSGSGKKMDIGTIAKGIELSVAGLKADAEEREAAAAAEAAKAENA